MTILGPPNRGNDPLNVLAMAGALVAAAVIGASVGYLIDLGSDSDNGGSQPDQQLESGEPAD